MESHNIWGRNDSILYDALFKHWKRSCWVLSVWSQAHINNITYPTLQDYGWKQPDSKTLSIDWDSDNNVSEIRARVALIKRGCGCKTGCHTARCKCKKAGHHCGPGCKCLSCVNLPSEATHHSTCIDTESSIDSDDNFEEEHNEWSVWWISIWWLWLWQS